MAVTMRDVAALAGVSVKTVSRVVNLEAHTSPEMVRKVRSAITELGWVPNGSARTLRTGRTGVISIALPELRRPAVAMLTQALVGELARRGLQASIEPTRGEANRLRRLFTARGRLFDGIIVVGPPPDGVVEEHHSGTPLVLVQSGTRLPTDSVDADSVEAASLIARHLVVMGRACPVLLGPDEASRWADDLLAAFWAAGIERTPARVSGLLDRGDGVRAVEDLLRRGHRPDVLVCASDEVALGALSALLARGVKVPDEIAVIGHDNIDDGQFTTPSLTTVDPLPADIARMAVDLVTERLSGAVSADPRRVITPVVLVRRESTMGTEVG